MYQLGYIILKFYRNQIFRIIFDNNFDVKYNIDINITSKIVFKINL